MAYCSIFLDTCNKTSDKNLNNVFYSQATSPVTPVNLGKSQTKSEKRSGNTLYQELSFHDTDIGAADDDGAEITGKFILFTEFTVFHFMGID